MLCVIKLSRVLIKNILLLLLFWCFFSHLLCHLFWHLLECDLIVAFFHLKQFLLGFTKIRLVPRKWVVFVIFEWLLHWYAQSQLFDWDARFISSHLERSLRLFSLVDIEQFCLNVLGTRGHNQLMLDVSIFFRLNLLIRSFHQFNFAPMVCTKRTLVLDCCDPMLGWLLIIAAKCDVQLLGILRIMYSRSRYVDYLCLGGWLHL